jgi:DNA-directed RNA polymerase subunit L
MENSLMNEIMETLERLYKLKEGGYGHPHQTRPEPEAGITKEDPMKDQKAAEKNKEKLEDEKEERKNQIEKNSGDISRMRPPKK